MLKNFIFFVSLLTFDSCSFLKNYYYSLFQCCQCLNVKFFNAEVTFTQVNLQEKYLDLARATTAEASLLPVAK